jgi:hypothetical protein
VAGARRQSPAVAGRVGQQVGPGPLQQGRVELACRIAFDHRLQAGFFERGFVQIDDTPRQRMAAGGDEGAPSRLAWCR